MTGMEGWVRWSIQWCSLVLRWSRLTIERENTEVISNMYAGSIVNGVTKISKRINKKRLNTREPPVSGIDIFNRSIVD